MSEPTDPHFYDRADAVINLANDESKGIGSGKVSASLMYATSPSTLELVFAALTAPTR
ncbi:DUF3144 domain-containing protein [Solimonas terrae]|uniref:DUF3144 domain-containing protein n=1 Tax=Solimonas terrae TaxID=1396819 RepID=A0A6M2BLX9_9GAMM|nr:DUF3144 domain-containing protein [Solimonas terrae]NGY03165.1 DUF3144 domain-containing protein [Solimonas terrae]